MCPIKKLAIYFAFFFFSNGISMFVDYFLLKDTRDTIKTIRDGQGSSKLSPRVLDQK